MKLILFSLTFAYVFASGNCFCNIPPKFWCDSKDVATKCGVLEACSSRLWADMKAEPVHVDLYFESLCPGCRQFLTKMLYPTWKKFQSSGILSVGLYPYGNAHETQGASGSWNFTCQHGPDECTGNLIDNCILAHTNYDISKAFPVIQCIEDAQSPITAAKKCIEANNLDYDVINKCAKGAEGNKLMHSVAKKTDQLNPPHKYVPWIVLNDVHTETIEREAQDNLPKLICETYKGPKPSICSQYTQNFDLKLSYN